MPFSKYFQEQPIVHDVDDRNEFVQIPQFMQSGATLVPGGGVEIIQSSTPSSWFTNNGFNPTQITQFTNEQSSCNVWDSPYIPSLTSYIPCYSSSGFDTLSILARVANRPNPLINLGPVDMACSFVVVDTRRHDAPIVYASPSFADLTGYSPADVLGRNCRFLQSPDGTMPRGAPRPCPASQQAAAQMRKALAQDKECQTTVVNYRKGGEAFVNLVTVVPIRGGVAAKPYELDEVVYHVGFQVDLTMRESAPAVKQLPVMPAPLQRVRKVQQPQRVPLSDDLRALLASPAFRASIPLSTSTTLPSTPSTTAASSISTAIEPLGADLPLILLESLPDCILVVSLKGSFLYVAPVVRRVLGYEPQDLLGKAIASICHPADVVPVMRELKESSAPQGGSIKGEGLQAAGGYADEQGQGQGQNRLPRTVDLLFRARTPEGTYIWLECRGRLHVEPGKGRKVVVLSVRTRAVPRMRWGEVFAWNGLGRPQREQDFWGVVSAKGVFLAVGEGVRGLLGWEGRELVGRSVAEVVVPPSRTGAGRAGDREGREREREREREEALRIVEGLVVRACIQAGDMGRGGRMEMRVGARPGNRGMGDMGMGRGGKRAVEVVLYPCVGRVMSSTSSAEPLVCHVRAVSGSSPLPPVVPMMMQAGIATAGGIAMGMGATGREGEDVFRELDVGRGSSWQYELQQLRFANDRLREEVELLEGRSGASTVFMGRGQGVKRRWDPATCT